jgi:hypothetical protein
VTSSDIEFTLKKIKKKSSAGVDLISDKPLEPCLLSVERNFERSLLLQHLLLLFQMSISSGIVPQQLGQIKPISKKGKKDLDDCRSYPPIAVSSTSFKIFECFS